MSEIPIDKWAPPLKHVDKLEADNTRLREQRDAERGEVARLRERLEQEMCNNAPLREQVAELEQTVSDYATKILDHQAKEKLDG